MSFLLIDATRVIKILPQERQGPTYVVSIVAADVLATQGARPSATMNIDLVKPR